MNNLNDTINTKYYMLTDEHGNARLVVGRTTISGTGLHFHVFTYRTTLIHRIYSVRENSFDVIKAWVRNGGWKNVGIVKIEEM